MGESDHLSKGQKISRSRDKQGGTYANHICQSPFSVQILGLGQQIYNDFLITNS